MYLMVCDRVNLLPWLLGLGKKAHIFFHMGAFAFFPVLILSSFLRI